ncbi:MAG: HD domain-containing protein [Planctomycetota bacterium]|nr:HD domain-containing protein [Planctomycetota bacterium]
MPTFSPDSPAAFILAAADFAARKHTAQRRRDTAKTPYINHPVAVAALLTRVGGMTDPITLAAALLHDTVEDTETTPEEIEEHFGPDVRTLVAEVTDDKSLTKEERKRQQIEHAPELSHRARLIKLADKSCNVGDMTPTEPKDWPLVRKREYFDWAEQVVTRIQGTHPALETHFRRTLQTQRAALADL